jgi:acetylornithine deacetylase
MTPDRLTQAIELIERLVAFPTESSKSNLDLVAFVEEYFRRLGVAYVKVPNAVGDKAALFATIGPMRDGGIVLSGHTDVVPVTGQTWTGDPFRLRRDAGRLYGRGACDMKGFDGIVLAMIEEFQAADLKVPIHILLSYDEETTCLGPVDTIARFGKDLPRPGIVIVGEPTSLGVADAHKSIATYTTLVHGHEAHSAKPALGANAIEGACELVVELYRVMEELKQNSDPAGRFDPPYSTISVGEIHGGTARNILAKDCYFQWEFRGLPGVPQDLALRRLEAHGAAHVLPKLRRHAPDADFSTVTEIEIPGLLAEPGSPAETLALKLARSNRTVAVSFASEAGRFQTAGISTVLCGPGNIDRAHQPDEFIDITQIEAGIAFMRALVRELS